MGSERSPSSPTLERHIRQQRAPNGPSRQRLRSMQQPPSFTQLKQRIDSRTSIIGVIGLGYVGLPLVRAFHSVGFPVLGFDIDPQKISALTAGRSYLKHLGDELVETLAASDRFEATSQFHRLSEADVVILCVPTPLGPHREPDLSFVEKTTETIAAHGRPGQLVILESTTYPGTTRDLMLPILERPGLTNEVDLFVAYSPEREDPGRANESTCTIPKLVGGTGPHSSSLAVTLYQAAIEQVIPVSSAEVAESAKLLENIYRAVNIALVNEMKVVLGALDIDVWEVIEAASTKPFGFQPFYPGPGLGGHCIPIDPFYLTWKAREIGLPTRFIELAGEVNHQMPGYVIERTVLALNDEEKAVRGAHILILGLAYKPDVDDVRESPSLEIIDGLLALGAVVDYHDPYLPEMPRTRRSRPALKSVALTSEVVSAYDCVLIATHHSTYDWDWLGGQARLIVDCRGVMRNRKVDARIVQA
jgi:UDP-N-acetyl-D-glucosamine dehydrogenase